MKTAPIILAAAAILAVTAPAFAITAGGPQGTPAATLLQETVSATQQADESHSIREGVITEVAAGRDRILVNGSWLTIAPGQTRIFRRDIEVDRSVFEAGQKLRFTLVTGTTLGVIYVP